MKLYFCIPKYQVCLKLYFCVPKYQYYFWSGVPVHLISMRFSKTTSGIFVPKEKQTICWQFVDNCWAFGNNCPPTFWVQLLPDPNKSCIFRSVSRFNLIRLILRIQNMSQPRRKLESQSVIGKNKTMRTPLLPTPWNCNPSFFLVMRLWVYLLKLLVC